MKKRWFFVKAVCIVVVAVGLSVGLGVITREAAAAVMRIQEVVQVAQSAVVRADRRRVCPRDCGEARCRVRNAPFSGFLPGMSLSPAPACHYRVYRFAMPVRDQAKSAHRMLALALLDTT
nr:hypothetical protein [Candidatus Entotheonella palauensis]